MTNKPRLLIFDDVHVVENIKPALELWGYSVTCLSKAAFLEDVIQRNKFDLLIIAKEMRVSGPTLSERSCEPIETQILKLKDTVIDFEFGLKMLARLKEAGINLPVILTTTDDAENEVNIKDLDCICKAVVTKEANTFLEDLKQTIEKVLGGDI